MKHALPFFSLTLALAFVLAATAPAAAQTQHVTKKQQKKEVRNSIKAAKQVTSDYDASHLDVTAYNLRNGETGRKLKKAKKREEMPINEDGTAVVKNRWFSRNGAPARTRKN